LAPAPKRYRSTVTSDTGAVPAAEEFAIDEERSETGAIVLALHGDADLHVAPELRDRIAEVLGEGATSIVVDLSQVTFVDSALLGVLIDGLKRVRTVGGSLRLVVTSVEIRRIFEIMLLDRVFELDASRDISLARGSSPSG
jgi:anti-sigma B factor antagonist